MSARLIGLTGFAGSGKDAVGLILVEKWDFVRVGFADPLKDVARAIGWNGKKDDAGRIFLQQLGVAVREYIATDAWVDAAFRHIIPLLNGGTSVVVTDTRFANEIERIGACGGVIWRVDRPGVGPANNHVSEKEWLKRRPDCFVRNSGTLIDLGHEVHRSLGAR